MRLSSQVTLRLSSVHLSFPLLFTRLPPPSLPSICLLQPQARFLYLCAPLVVPAAIYLLVQHCYLHSLPCTLNHAADPSCPLAPHSAQPQHSALHIGADEQCKVSEQKCIRRRSQALGGLGRRGCYLGQQPIAAHPRLYPLSMQHATLSSNHIQTSTRSSVTEREIAPYFSTQL